MIVNRVVLFVLALVGAPALAAAHPHVFVDAKAEIVFDPHGQITAVRNIWQFDEMFSEYAIQGLDTNNDGKLSDDELAPLAKVNINSLKDFDFFTYLTVGKPDDRRLFVVPTEYWLEFHSGKLTLFFTLPLEKPTKVHSRTTLEVFDPEYFVAFSFLGDHPVTLDGAPAGCSAAYKPPKELDADTMAMLGAIPADQPDLPQALQDAAAGLANLIDVTCG